MLKYTCNSQPTYLKRPENALTTKRARNVKSISESDMSESDDSTTQNEMDTSKKGKARSGTRAKKKHCGDRKAELEGDEWVKSGSVGPHCLTCRRCDKRVNLHKKHTYDAGNWTKHRIRCPAITGKKQIRVSISDGKQTVVRVKQKLSRLHLIPPHRQQCLNIEVQRVLSPQLDKGQMSPLGLCNRKLNTKLRL